ncbi:hypothetical protein R1sor_007715 [Riccia sorocarpa]|uniref:Uncharacterized protein n=1 Tax=Riccia sorocarpa TaxID=122646 RepID=A0ABD3HUQ2_9MARC
MNFSTSLDFSKWTTVSTRLVKSEAKREPEWMELSILDSPMWDGIHTSFFLLYKSEPGADADDVLPIDRLIGSLGKALEHFYPFAGRLIKPEKDKAVRLFCNNEGTPFTHKHFDGVVSDLMDVEQFESNELLSGLYDDYPAAEVFDASGVPTLIIQVTDFKCGTRCLSTSWSHNVADGFSGTHFLASWAQIARGEPISLLPVHNRTLLGPRKSSRVLDGGPCRFLNNIIEEPAVLQLAEPEGGIGVRSFKLSRRRMNELNAEALRHSQVGTLSTANCVSAHLWRLITVKRGHAPHEMTRFLTLVNCRPRLKDCPAGYFGNCIAITASPVTVGELLSNSLGHAATIIHKAIKELNEDVIRDYIDWLSVNKFQRSSVGDELFMPGDPSSNLHTVQASWQNWFPLYELDFGGGRPSLALRNGCSVDKSLIGTFFALPTSIPNSQGDLSISVYGGKNVLGRLDDEL